jgi:hypothetical protein
VNLRPETVRHLLAIGHDLTEAPLLEEGKLTDAARGRFHVNDGGRGDWDRLSGHLAHMKSGRTVTLGGSGVKVKKDGGAYVIHDSSGHRERLGAAGPDVEMEAAHRALSRHRELTEAWSPQARAAAAEARKFKKGDRVKIKAAWGDMGTVMSDEVEARNQGDPNATETTLAVMKDGSKAPLVYRKSDLELAEGLAESAQTAALSVTHAPIGKGGTNWVTKSKPGNQGQLPAYIQNIRNAMMRDGKDESTATAMAVGAVKRWAAGRGGVSKEVQAAAAKAVAQWESVKAAGKAAGKADEAGKKAA